MSTHNIGLGRKLIDHSPLARALKRHTVCKTRTSVRLYNFYVVVQGAISTQTLN